MADYKIRRYIKTLQPYLIAANTSREALPKNMHELEGYLARSSISKRTIRAIVATVTPGDDVRSALHAWDFKKSSAAASHNFNESAGGQALSKEKKRRGVEFALKASALTPQGVLLCESYSQIAKRFGISRQRVCAIKRLMDMREAELIDVLLKAEENFDDQH